MEWWGGGSYVRWAGGRKQHAVNQERTTNFANTLFTRASRHLGAFLILFRVYSCDIWIQANSLIFLAAANARLVPNTIPFKSRNISADSFPSCII